MIYVREKQILAFLVIKKSVFLKKLISLTKSLKYTCLWIIKVKNFCPEHQDLVSLPLTLRLLISTVSEIPQKYRNLKIIPPICRQIPSFMAYSQIIICNIFTLTYSLKFLFLRVFGHCQRFLLPFLRTIHCLILSDL